MSVHTGRRGQASLRLITPDNIASARGAADRALVEAIAGDTPPSLRNCAELLHIVLDQCERLLEKLEPGLAEEIQAHINTQWDRDYWKLAHQELSRHGSWASRRANPSGQNRILRSLLLKEQKRSAAVRRALAVAGMADERRKWTEHDIKGLEAELRAAEEERDALRAEFGHLAGELDGPRPQLVASRMKALGEGACAEVRA